MTPPKKTPEAKPVAKEKKFDDRIVSLPDLDKLEGNQFSGYSPITRGTDTAKEGENLFYWFVGDDNYADRPTILWTNGGPGSTSFWGFFTENGPYEITTEEQKEGDNSIPKTKLIPRENAWNESANYMIIEHPLDVTLSFPKDNKNVPSTPQEGVKEYYNALINFMDKHPEIAKNPIILAGESYAGTYLPLLAAEILKGNENGETKLNILSTVLMDAWVDPIVQMKKNTKYAHSHGLISKKQKKELDKEYQGEKLSKINDAIHDLCGVYMADTAATGDPSIDPIMAYLNRDDVRTAIHAIINKVDVLAYSDLVYENYKPSTNESFAYVVADLLKAGQKIQVISGLNDAKDCNFLGTEAWLKALKGKASKSLKNATPQQWKDKEDFVIGFDQNGGLLSWLKVLNAGHMAAMNQPLIIEKIMEFATTKVEE